MNVKCEHVLVLLLLRRLSILYFYRLVLNIAFGHQFYYVLMVPMYYWNLLHMHDFIEHRVIFMNELFYLCFVFLLRICFVCFMCSALRPKH